MVPCKIVGVACFLQLQSIFVATENNLDLVKAAKVYFAAGERINLLWFRDQIAHDSREGHWNSLARLTLRDELDYSHDKTLGRVPPTGNRS